MKQPNKLKKHEEKYLHIPKRSLGFGLLTILLIGLTIFSFYFTIDSWKFLELGSLECSEDFCSYKLYQLLIIFPLFLDYIFISLAVISFVSMFKKLRRYNEKGLVSGLGFCLVFCLLISLLIGLLDGLLGGLLIGLSGGLLNGLILCLVVGLIGGLLIGLISGLIREFNQK